MLLLPKEINDNSFPKYAHFACTTPSLHHCFSTVQVRRPFSLNKGKLLVIVSLVVGFLTALCFTSPYKFVICISGFQRILDNCPGASFSFEDLGCLLSLSSRHLTFGNFSFDICEFFDHSKLLSSFNKTTVIH